MGWSAHSHQTSPLTRHSSLAGGRGGGDGERPIGGHFHWEIGEVGYCNDRNGSPSESCVQTSVTLARGTYWAHLRRMKPAPHAHLWPENFTCHHFWTIIPSVSLQRISL